MEGDTEFWTSHVEACRREGSAASVYARQHGLRLASLYYWRRKLKLAAAVNDGRDGGSTGKFVALRVMDVAGGAPTGPCTLVLRSGLRLELA
jgi:transposase-like protein